MGKTDQGFCEIDDLDIAAFLIVKNLQHTGTRCLDRFIIFQYPKRKEEEIAALINEFRLGGQVSAKQFAMAIREIRKLAAQLRRMVPG